MAAMAMDMEGPQDASGARTPHGACNESVSDRQADRGTGHGGVPPAGCATVAHCVVVAPAPVALPGAPSALVAARPREVSTTLPRSPALEPEFPPPRA